MGTSVLQPNSYGTPFVITLVNSPKIEENGWPAL